MSIIYNPRSELLRDPNLLVPGKKPGGKVKIDWSHDLTKNLYFFSVPSLNNHNEFVSNIITQLHSSAARAIVGGRECLNSTDAGFTNNGTYTPRLVAPSTAVNYPVTMLIFAEEVSTGNWSKLVSFPYHNDEWGNPFIHLSLSRDDDAGHLYIHFRRDSGGLSGIGQSVETIAYTTNQPTMFGTSFPAGKTVSPKFYKYQPGSIQAYTTGDTFPYDRQFGAMTTGVAVHNRSLPAFAGEAPEGQYYWCAVWSRELSETEIMEMYLDPYQFLIPA